VTTVTTALVPEQVKKHPFHGLAVCETAGLRLRPGSPRPRFEQDVWDLTGLADAPTVMSTHRKILDFTAITHPLWRLVAREHLMARLAPLHPAVATLPHAFRVALNPHSLWGELRQLTRWFNHLTAAGVTTLADVDQQHCARYLAVVARSATNPDRVLSPVTTTSMVRVPQFLALYSEILSDPYRPGFTPWAGRSADEVAGYTRTNVNQVPPVPDSVLRPLLANSLYLLETISPHLVLEAQAVRAADRHEAASRRGLLIGEIPTMRDGIEHRRATNVPAPLISASSLQSA